MIKIAIQDIDHYIPRIISRLLEGKLYNRSKPKKSEKSKEKKNGKRASIWSRRSLMSSRKSKSAPEDGTELGPLPPHSEAPSPRYGDESECKGE